MSRDLRPVDIMLINELQLKPTEESLEKIAFSLCDENDNPIENIAIMLRREHLRLAFPNVYIYAPDEGIGLMEKAEKDFRVYELLIKLETRFKTEVLEGLCGTLNETLKEPQYQEDISKMELSDVVHSYFYGKLDNAFYYSTYNIEKFNEYMKNYTDNFLKTRVPLDRNDKFLMLHYLYKLNWMREHLTYGEINKVEMDWIECVKNGEGVTDKMRKVGIDHMPFSTYEFLYGYNGQNYSCLKEFDELEANDPCVIKELAKYLPEPELFDKYYKLPLLQPLKDDNSKTGGVSYMGETLLDFMAEAEIPLDTPIRQINEALRKCGIKPVKHIKEQNKETEGKVEE